MNRDIKFRALYSNSKDVEFVYGDLVHCNNNGKDCLMIKEFIYNVNNGKCNLIPCGIKEDTLGQDTVFKDMLGKPIYEGDVILEIDTLNGLGEVDMYYKTIFNDELGQWVVMGLNNNTWNIPLHQYTKIEVVGNIHDGKEYK